MRTLAALSFLLAGAVLAQDPFLDTLRPSPAPILAYSESLAPMYEGVFPNGEPHPLYSAALSELERHPAFGAALARFRTEAGDPAAEPLPAPIRDADFDRVLAPGLTALARSVRKMTKGPVVLGVVVTPETPDIARQWIVQGVHTPPAESLLRPWLLSRALARTFPGVARASVREAALTPRAFVDWLRSSVPSATDVAVHVGSGPSHPIWAELAKAGAVPFRDVTELSGSPVVYHEQPPRSILSRYTVVPAPAQAAVCGWGIRTISGKLASEPAEEPGTAPLELPRFERFDREDGSPDLELLARVFRRDGKGLYDKWLARARDFRSERGERLLEGRVAGRGELARMELAIRRDPRAIVMQRVHRPPRLGDRDLARHLFVLSNGASTLVPAPGSAQAIDDSGRAAWLPAAIVRDADRAEASRRRAASLAPSASALEAARLFDTARYERLVRVLAGELATPGRRPFVNRANGLPDHQLEEVLDYLAVEYRKLGLQPKIDRFTDGGRSWANLWADIPGQTSEIVLMADHYDTAIDEASAEAGAREYYRPAAGADDNATATAALLEHARVLKSLGYRPRHTIRLLHLTGEEFPADCLGARRYAQRMLETGERVRAFLVIDMIGRRLDRGTFQLNEGESPASGALAGAGLAASKALGTGPQPIVRSRFDPRSYLYNTDGVIFSDLGVPTLLFNERINRLENFTARGNHDAHDTCAGIDFEYAAAIARVALMTAIAAAE